jgi:hypothetical protein
MADDLTVNDRRLPSVAENCLLQPSAAVVLPRTNISQGRTTSANGLTNTALLADAMCRTPLRTFFAAGRYTVWPPNSLGQNLGSLAFLSSQGYEPIKETPLVNVTSAAFYELLSTSNQTSEALADKTSDATGRKKSPKINGSSNLGTPKRPQGFESSWKRNRQSVSSTPRRMTRPMSSRNPNERGCPPLPQSSSSSVNHPRVVRAPRQATGQK